MTPALTVATRPGTSKPPSSMATPEPLAVTLMSILQQLQAVVGCLRDEQYAMRPVGVVDSSIGGHVRHCLDHVGALLRGVDSGVMDYDARERGTAIESDRFAALDAIRLLRLRLRGLPAHVRDRPITLSVVVTGDGLAVQVGTTVGREMAYVLSHTIHHHALIATMVKILGGWLPERFGYAPATIAYLTRDSCAR